MRQAMLRIVGLLAVTSMIWAATPRPVNASPPAGCECGAGQFKCTYSDGSCTCLNTGQICSG